MCRTCSAAAAYNIDAEIFCKVCDLRRESFRRLAVVLRAVSDFGETCIGEDRNKHRRIFAEIANVLGHVLWSGSAVHPNDINRERLKRSQSGACLRTVQHRAEDFDCDLSDDRYAPLHLLEVLEDCCERGLRLQQVLTGFDNEHVNAAIEESAHLLRISRFQVSVSYVSKRWQFRSWPHRACDPARLALSGIVVGDPPGEFGGFVFYVVSPV